MAIALVAALYGCTEPQPEVPPRQLTESFFQYPESLWDAGVEGETILELLVSEEGGVDSITVETSSGYEEFDSAAVVGARDLEFEPAQRGERNVAVRVLLPVQFNLPSEMPSAPAESAP